MSARIPEVLHNLRGTRPSRAADNGEDIQPARPKFPRSLTPEAKQIFKSLCQQLEERRALTAGDVQILHVFAEVHARWIHAREKIKELGEVVNDTRLDSNGTAHEVLRKNPWLSVVEVCETKMHAILRDLGLTPNARARVKQVGVPKATQDPMESFLEQGRTVPSTSLQNSDLEDFELKEIQ
jgi:P27 family predicted phage terminase small subunit